MKKNKGYDVTNNHDVDLSRGFLGLTYNGGDLGERNNVDNTNDIYNAVQNIEDFFTEHNYRNWKYSFTDFYAVLNYDIPHKHQYEYFKKIKNMKPIIRLQRIVQDTFFYNIFKNQKRYMLHLHFYN